MRLDTKTIVIFLIGLITIPANAQYRRNKFELMRGARLTPMVGVNMFYGDLVDQSRTSYSFGTAFERDMNRYLAARTHLMYGQMKGQQLNSENEVYAFFENKYFEFGLGANFRPLDLALGYYKQRTLNPYVVGQIGINYYDATEWYGETITEIYAPGHPNAGEPKAGNVWHAESSITPVFTLGGGLNYWLNPRISIRGELLANQPVSDMLDAHKEWDDPQGIIHKTDNIDFYYTATIGVSILLQDNRWRNEPKYNRKAYIKIRKYNLSGSKKRTKYKSSRRRR